MTGPDNERRPARRRGIEGTPSKAVDAELTPNTENGKAVDPSAGRALLGTRARRDRPLSGRELLGRRATRNRLVQPDHYRNGKLPLVAIGSVSDLVLDFLGPAIDLAIESGEIVVTNVGAVIMSDLLLLAATANGAAVPDTLTFERSDGRTCAIFQLARWPE